MTLNWVSVSDRFPSAEGSYIVCTERGAVCTAHFHKDHGRFSGRNLKVTHWMHLPSKPMKESIAPVSPCVNCKRKPNCPKVCHPKRDWMRRLKKKGALKSD